MSTASNLSDLSISELKDLGSANDQMMRALKEVMPHATNPKLKQRLEASQSGTADHTNRVKALFANQDEKVCQEHCKRVVKADGLMSELAEAAVNEEAADA